MKHVRWNKSLLKKGIRQGALRCPISVQKNLIQGKIADSELETFLESLESFEITWNQRNFEIIDSGGSTSRRFGNRHTVGNFRIPGGHVTFLLGNGFL